MKHMKGLAALALALGLLVFLSSGANAQTSVSLTGRLTNDRGEPLPGQRLYLQFGPTNAMATSDADGRYAFSVAAGNYELYITRPESYDSSVHTAAFYYLRTTSFDLVQNTTLDLQLPFKKLSVHAQDSQGSPVANVLMGADGSSAFNVAIGSLPTGTLLASGPSFYSYADGIATNTNGDVDLWLLPTPSDPSSCGMPSCGYTLMASPPAGGQLGTTVLSGVTLTQDRAVTITLQPSTLSGRVTDAQGNPLAGLALALRGSAGVTAATTDTSGRYTFSVPADSYSLIVANSPSGNCPSYGIGPYGPWCFHIDGILTLTPNMTLDLALPFKRVTVHVVDANGQPIAGAALSTNAPTSDPFTLGGVTFTGRSSYAYDANVGGGLTTDANGNATFLLLPVTPSPGLEQFYTLTAYPPAATGLPAKSLPSVWVSGDTSFTISYVSSVTLSGRITDAAGNGLPNQSVWLWGPDYPSGSTDGNGNYAFTISPGYYTMVVQGGVPIDSGLHAPQHYEVQSDHHAVAVTQNRTFDVALPFQRVNMHVVDANDQPVAGASLSAHARNGDMLTLGGVAFYDVTWNGDPYWSLTTDISGNATLWLLPASDQPWEGDGYTFMAAAPPETGLDLPAYLSSVFVTRETNVTLRFIGALPGLAPVIRYLTPGSVPAQSPGFTLIVNGSGFVDRSVVRWNGADRSTTYVSLNQLAAVIPSTDIAAPGTANVTVWTPAPGGGDSNAISFRIDLPSATINVYAAMHTPGTGGVSWQKTRLALSLKVFDRATFPSADLKDYATIWNSGPGLEEPFASIIGPTPTTFSNGLANLYTVRVPAAGSVNTMTSGRYVVVGKVYGAETYVGAATDNLAVNSVTDVYLQVVQQSNGQIAPAVATSGAPTPSPKATQTPKPTATPTAVPTSKAPKPTPTPKKSPAATPTPKKPTAATPAALPTQTPVPAATATPKKPLTATPAATWTLPPTKTPHLTPTPRNKPTKR